MSQRSSILNLDLRLRASYPDIQTSIYELSPFHHVIVAPKNHLDADTFSEEFNSKWRMITDRVEFRNQPPTNAQKIPSLSNSEIGQNLSGIYLSEQALKTVLQGKFPKLPPIWGTRNGVDHKIYFGFESLPKGEYLDDLNSFLSAALHGRPYEFEILNSPKKYPDSNDPKLKAMLNSFNALAIKPIQERNSVPDFVKEEEYWWFEKLPELFSGHISTNSLKPASGREDKSACYLHSTIGHQIDIRQLLFAYDLIYMEPPLTDGHDESLSFWSTQSINQDDLLSLVEADRVRLIHSQPEERGDLGFLSEAKGINPNGVIGRRKTAALMIADIVETADEYLLGSSKVSEEIFELTRRMSEAWNIPHDELAKILFFPEYMRRACLEPFTDRGLMGLMNLGQGEIFSERVKRVTGKEIVLEAATFGQAIHTAHMLDATYIPIISNSDYASSWIQPTRMMGELLNFYRSFNARIAPAWAANERHKIEKHPILPAIPLLDFKEDVTIQEIINLSQSNSDRFRGHALISKLSQLPENERPEEMRKLVSEHSAWTSKNKKRSKKIQIADAVITTGAHFGGLSLFPFNSIIILVEQMLKYAKKSPSLDAIISELELSLDDTIGRNSDLTFMSKISRVAEIKTEQE